MNYTSHLTEYCTLKLKKNGVALMQLYFAPLVITSRRRLWADKLKATNFCVSKDDGVGIHPEFVTPPPPWTQLMSIYEASQLSSLCKSVIQSPTYGGHYLNGRGSPSWIVIRPNCRLSVSRQFTIHDTRGMIDWMEVTWGETGFTQKAAL